MRVICCALFVLGVVAACGETRRPIGDECVRDEDCLSGVCSARTCVSAPPLKVGASGPTKDEEPDIPDASDAAAVDAPADAPAEGG